MYSPSLGRFMQTDPIGYADGMNWYNYVGGDPVNAVDPTGMSTSGQGWYGCTNGFHGWFESLDDLADACGPNDKAMTDWFYALLDTIIVTGYRNGRIGENRIGLSYIDPKGLEWLIYITFEFEFIDALAAEQPGMCPGAYVFKPTVAPTPNLAGLFHGHQDLNPKLSGREQRALRYPGPGDGSTPAALGIPNYMASSTDLWKIDGALNVDHLVGRSRFPAEARDTMMSNANRVGTETKRGKATKPC